jgi:hypothetical protein
MNLQSYSVTVRLEDSRTREPKGQRVYTVAARHTDEAQDIAESKALRDTRRTGWLVHSAGVTATDENPVTVDLKPEFPPVYGVNCAYGAPMGRPSVNQEDRDNPKISLQRVRINSGGYDSGGAYWGVGAPLWWAGSDGGEYSEWFRARDRQAAKDIVRHAIPGARFYR